MTAQEIYNQALFWLRDAEGAASNSNSLPPVKGLILLNEAINEACRRSKLLIDRSTAAICSIPVVAGTASYALDSRIIKVKNARLVTAGRVLGLAHAADLDACDPLWMDRTGEPYQYLTDAETDKITLYRKPVATDTLALTVVRLPLVPITTMSATPEINPRFHSALASYLVYRARSIDDTETYDPRKAQVALSEFEIEFGPKRSAWAETFENTQPVYGDE